MSQRNAAHLLPTEALSAKDAARVFHVEESATRQILLARVRAGEDGFAVEGGPLRVRGTWLATLGWWQRALSEGGQAKE